MHLLVRGNFGTNRRYGGGSGGTTTLEKSIDHMKGVGSVLKIVLV